jgi:hypothetical protein
MGQGPWNDTGPELDEYNPEDQPEENNYRGDESIWSRSHGLAWGEEWTSFMDRNQIPQTSLRRREPVHVPEKKKDRAKDRKKKKHWWSSKPKHGS